MVAAETPTQILALPPVVTREEWQIARTRLLAQEKALTRLKDAVSAQRRRLPMVEVDAGYRFEGADDTATLLDLFEGRRQLIMHHFMFGTDWDEGCVGCSMMADHMGPLAHLHARDVSFAMVSRAPIGKLLAYRTRMGWDLPWYSSAGTTFNDDFHVTVDGDEQTGLSVFLRDGDRVFHTWQTGDRGVEVIINALHYLDLTPFGRQEAWEDSPSGWLAEPDDWWRRHDRYDTDGRG